MGNSRNLLPFYITVCIVSFVISKIVIAVLCYRRWKRKHMEVHDTLSAAGGKLVMFRTAKMKEVKSSALVKRTMKLSNKDIIGSGGYGTVYRLAMGGESSSVCFAVKKLNRMSGEQDRGFEREVEAMADIKHRNIVTLHGYYTTPLYNLLIYELMPNGSLDKLLHEYFDTGKATVKGDVYSFGVVLLELLTGRKPSDEVFIEEGSKLVSWVKAVVASKREEYVVDSNLEKCPIDETIQVFNVAMMCLEYEPSKRPTMAEVVKLLEQIKLDALV
nr:receptor-like serine/threonine-protein kinase At1g78530 [Ipomoea batatas]